MKNREKAIKRVLREKENRREKKEIEFAILEVKKEINNQTPDEVVVGLLKKIFFN